MKSLLAIFAIVLAACTTNSSRIVTPVVKRTPMEISDFYRPVKVQSTYSAFVRDSFNISIVMPQKHATDTLAKYPLILVLDANAYLEAVTSELKLGTLTQGYPPSIVVGIGYKGFWAMDSLRNRDYTYPTAPPADSFKLSGGALKFKQFINEELLPDLHRQFKIDSSKVILMGHSLAGYFVLYYFLDAMEKGERQILNFVAASPSLWYSNGYLFEKEEKLPQTMTNTPFKLLVSMGSLEREPADKESDFQRLKGRLDNRPSTIVKSNFIELGNFNHMEAAIPGFMKGLSFLLVEE